MSEPSSAGRRPGPRSERVRPALVVGLLGLAVAGALLYDAAASWTGHRAGSWRSRAAHQLATRPLDSGWVLAGAAVLALLGCWLLVLACARGERRWLPLRQHPGAVIDRVGVAALVETRVVGLPMVAAARVRVRRRRARVTVYGSADLVQVREAAAAELARIGLVREPALRVRGRPARHRPPMH
ncbi:hypothetical protein C7C46_32185 [Streptomyces tateyamensis]|uniref:DUF6286 domain-containing protein n=1 Tax=Streptomyces tateyamensis TaxID=565073 RepID=A0A2V4NX77_9ACTN|nr:DUF6286 domain-containing protein [Streptomyces tateyamensis]PYC65747.1 hypothetical protein C7C46_32185 [Streptomyces tateyamensis]